MRQSLMPRLCRLPFLRYVAMLAPLALPNCNQVWGLDGTKGAPDVQRLNPGGLPRQYAILCDIESRRVPRRCATAGEVAADAFVTQSSGAVALTVRQTHNARLRLFRRCESGMRRPAAGRDIRRTVSGGLARLLKGSSTSSGRRPTPMPIRTTSASRCATI